eukprot:4464127-Alexandrium_andersonii.AAC.1
MFGRICWPLTGCGRQFAVARGLCFCRRDPCHVDVQMLGARSPTCRRGGGLIRCLLDAPRV